MFVNLRNSEFSGGVLRLPTMCICLVHTDEGFCALPCTDSTQAPFQFILVPLEYDDYMQAINQKTKVAVLYWGRRGGGQLLTDQLVKEALVEGYEVLCFQRPGRIGSSRRPIGLTNVLGWCLAIRNVVKLCKCRGIKTCIIPMASPWDILLPPFLKRNGIRVTRIIHDASKHPGDIFPPNFWIKRLCRDSDALVVLSQYVGKELIRRYGVNERKISFGQLPIPEIPIVQGSDLQKFEKFFLFIGRGREYKGLDLLLKAWPMVGGPESRLVIAGEGHRGGNLPDRVIHIDRWLQDSEVFELIRNSIALVLPYVEASQSGLIPIARSVQTPVVITPVGGLREQVIENVTAIVTSDLSPNSLAESMNRIPNEEFSFNSTHEDITVYKLLQMCLM